LTSVDYKGKTVDLWQFLGLEGAKMLKLTNIKLTWQFSPIFAVLDDLS
jgi:hypothetical protein